MFGTVVGRVGQIKKAEHVGQGTFLLGFSVAEDKYMGPNKDKVTTWHDCAFFGKRAESVSRYVTVGAMIAVNGQSYVEEYDGSKYLKVARGQRRPTWRRPAAGTRSGSGATSASAAAPAAAGRTWRLQ
jgi:single-stranded DNA-binding protein